GAESVVGANNLEISTTLTNDGDSELKILNDPNSILDTFPANSFVVESESGSPSFIGAKVKYSLEAAAAEGAYTVLAPGESVTVTHNLGHAYNFSVPGEGAYDIQPSNVFYVVDDSGSVSSITADTPTAHKMQLSGTLAVESPHLSKRIAYNGCSADRQTLIVAAANGANTYAAGAYSYLQGIGATTPRYAYWFGAYSGANKATVQGHYQNIVAHNFLNDYTYDCTCTMAGVFAYVYPTRFGTIFLCPVFWQTTTLGTDSRAGTLVHESSHFNIIAGTQDVVYGQAGAHNLALSNPNSAITNADSHEYFAENTPFLA
ncbi:peptidyl-Lys metalloendopeptidase, partial [Cylindrobasidium torrendii FP15055 ss-10]